MIFINFFPDKNKFVSDTSKAVLGMEVDIPFTEEGGTEHLNQQFTRAQVEQAIQSNMSSCISVIESILSSEQSVFLQCQGMGVDMRNHLQQNQMEMNEMQGGARPIVDSFNKTTLLHAKIQVERTTLQNLLESLRDTNEWIETLSAHIEDLEKDYRLLNDGKKLRKALKAAAGNLTEKNEYIKLLESQLEQLKEQLNRGFVSPIFGSQAEMERELVRLKQLVDQLEKDKRNAFVSPIFNSQQEMEAELNRLKGELARIYAMGVEVQTQANEKLGQANAKEQELTQAGRDLLAHHEKMRLAVNEAGLQLTKEIAEQKQIAQAHQNEISRLNGLLGEWVTGFNRIRTQFMEQGQTVDTVDQLVELTENKIMGLQKQLSDLQIEKTNQQSLQAMLDKTKTDMIADLRAEKKKLEGKVAKLTTQKDFRMTKNESDALQREIDSKNATLQSAINQLKEITSILRFGNKEAEDMDQNDDDLETLLQNEITQLKVESERIMREYQRGLQLFNNVNYEIDQNVEHAAALENSLVILNGHRDNLIKALFKGIDTSETGPYSSLKSIKVSLKELLPLVKENTNMARSIKMGLLLHQLSEETIKQYKTVQVPKIKQKLKKKLEEVAEKLRESALINLKGETKREEDFLSFRNYFVDRIAIIDKDLNGDFVPDMIMDDTEPPPADFEELLFLIGNMLTKMHLIINDRDTEILDLKDQLDVNEKLVKQAQDNAQRALERHAELWKQLNTANQLVAQKAQEYQDLNAFLQAKETEKDKELLALREANQRVKEKYETEQAAYLKEAGELREIVRVLNHEIENFKKVNAALQVTKEQGDAEIDSLKQRLADLMVQSMDLDQPDDAYDLLVIQNDERMIELTNLKKEFEDLKIQLREAKIAEDVGADLVAKYIEDNESLKRERDAFERELQECRKLGRAPMIPMEERPMKKQRVEPILISDHVPVVSILPPEIRKREVMEEDEAELRARMRSTCRFKNGNMGVISNTGKCMPVKSLANLFRARLAAY